MKKLILIIILLLNTIFSAGALMCQESSSVTDPKYQAAHAEGTTKDSNENNIVDDKNVRVRILEWIIKHNITRKYQRIEEDELMDMLEER